MDADMVVMTLFRAGLNVLLLAIFASPLLFVFRREIRSLVAKRPRIAIGLLVVLAIPVVAFSYHQVLYAPLLTYSGPAGKHWIDEAVRAPTREERVKHVQRVATQSEYGGHIAWQTIRKVPDRKMRCELYAIVMSTPNVRSTSNVEDELKKECVD